MYWVCFQCSMYAFFMITLLQLYRRSKTAILHCFCQKGVVPFSQSLCSHCVWKSAFKWSLLYIFIFSAYFFFGALNCYCVFSTEMILHFHESLLPQQGYLSKGYSHYNISHNYKNPACPCREHTQMCLWATTTYLESGILELAAWWLLHMCESFHSSKYTCFAKAVAISSMLSAMPHLQTTAITDPFSKGDLRRLTNGLCRKLGSSIKQKQQCLLLSDMFKKWL